MLVVALVVVITALVGPLPLSGAPFPLPLGPGCEPITVSMYYGTEKEDWLQEATQRFMKTNPKVGNCPVTDIQLEGIGSREVVEKVVKGEIQPDIVSPASSIQVELLRYEWETSHGTAIFRDDHAPVPLVYTPLVVVAWQERARALWPNGPKDLWNNLQKVLTNDKGWDAFGHPEWGFAKFGHTSPETSNSGIQTLVLLAYGYHNKTSGLTKGDVLDSGFQEWLDGIEGSVWEFGDSTGTFMQNMVLKGPSTYDFVVVYENLAADNVEAAKGKWDQPLRVYYPPATIFSDHPYVILNADWVKDEEVEAAALFRDFLLSQEIQELALQYGFRPVSNDVSVTSSIPNNPFTLYEEYGIQADAIPPQVEIPSGDVLNELITLWRRKDYD